MKQAKSAFYGALFEALKRVTLVSLQSGTAVFYGDVDRSDAQVVTYFNNVTIKAFSQANVFFVKEAADSTRFGGLQLCFGSYWCKRGHKHVEFHFMAIQNDTNFLAILLSYNPSKANAAHVMTKHLQR